MKDEIVRKAIDCFVVGKPFLGESRGLVQGRCRAKLCVKKEGNISKLLLDNNVVATREVRQRKTTVVCPNRFDTTIALLNQIGGVHVRLNNGVLYLNSYQWDGKSFEL